MQRVEWDSVRPLNRPEWSALDAQKLELDAPDQHLQIWDGDRLLARASVWLNGPRLQPSEVTGLIGHYAADSLESGRAMLEFACETLQRAGCVTAIGPMDGSTWKSYRLVSDAGSSAASSAASSQTSEAPFLLEPHNPLDWNAHFLNSGFTVLASYHSSLSLDPSHDPRVPSVRERLTRGGVTTRAADPAQLESELESLFDLICESFAGNFLYTALSKPDFLRLYRPLLERLPAGFTRIAEHNGRMVGFAFAVPDLLRPQPDTLILKTVGVRPGRAYAGLGRLLGDELHDLARAVQMPRVIHALMHDSNVSANSSARTSHVIRRYALYSRSLL